MCELRYRNKTLILKVLLIFCESSHIDVLQHHQMPCAFGKKERKKKEKTEMKREMDECDQLQIKTRMMNGASFLFSHIPLKLKEQVAIVKIFIS